MKKNSRFWEIDFFRGTAIVLMIIFNYAFTLSYFNIYYVDGWLFWWLFPRFIAAIFILLVGISLTISYSRTKKKMKSHAYEKYIIRGLKIFSLGMLVTLATWLFVPQTAILFGILHFIGISIIISLVFIKFRYNLLLGLLIIATGIFLNNFVFDFPWLLWVGFVPKIFYTLDYFPLLPWFGMFLIGMSLGNKFYKNGTRRFKIFNELKLTKSLSFLGRHSLIIYLIHQPILVAILYLFGYSVLI